MRLPGPWWFIPQAVNYPDQIVNMIPALCPISVAVNSSACSGQTANCPLPIPTLWSVSGAFELANGPQTASTDVAFDEFAQDMATLLRIQGSGQYIVNRMTLHNGGDANQPAFLDFHGMMLSNSYEVVYPGGASYTLDSGFVSAVYVSIYNDGLLMCFSSLSTGPCRLPAGPVRMAPASPRTRHYQTHTPRATPHQCPMVYTLAPSTPTLQEV